MDPYKHTLINNDSSPSKRPRKEGEPTPSSSTSQIPTSKGALQGFVICVPPGTGISHLSARLKAWTSGVNRLGGRLTQDPGDPEISHVLVGPPGSKGLPQDLLHRCTAATSDSDEDIFTTHHSPILVAHTWLEQALLTGVHHAEGRHRPRPATPRRPPPPPVTPLYPLESVDLGNLGGISHYLGFQQHRSGISQEALTHHRRWLGEYWHPACADMTLNELVLQNIYNEERSKNLGNERIALALAEMGTYERGLNEDYFEHPEKGEETVNHRALRYAHAAAVVRGCAYTVRGNLKGGELPFVGPATSKQINEICARGTCDTLEAFRRDMPVTDSRGVLRKDTVGGCTRTAFHKLPGVGQRTAKLWWDLGCRNYPDVELAAQDGGPLGPGGRHKMSVEQRFSLEHREDLLDKTSKISYVII